MTEEERRDMLIAHHQCCRLINSTPRLKDLLYDLNLLPEQVEFGSKDHWTMMRISAAFEIRTGS